MARRLRLALAGIWAMTLVAVAVLATNLIGGGRGATPHQVVVQPPPAMAAASRAVDAPTVPTADTTTPATATPKTTVAQTTTRAPSPTPAPTTPRPPKSVPAAIVRPATTTAPSTAPRVTTPPSTAAAVSGGTANDFSLIGYRWDPCRVITMTSMGPDISGIVSELASITGLHLQYVSGVPLANITVIWGAVPPGGEIGLTAWRAVGGWLTEAGIVISQQAQPYLATVLRHELGHALGLGHAARANEIMYPTAGRGSPTDFQAGDVAGLTAVGASTGC